MYDDAVVDLVVLDHLMFASAVLNCSGSLMSLQIFAILVRRWMLFMMVSSVLPSFLSSSPYLRRSGVLFTGRCVESMTHRLIPAFLGLVHSKCFLEPDIVRSCLLVARCTSRRRSWD